MNKNIASLVFAATTGLATEAKASLDIIEDVGVKHSQVNTTEITNKNNPDTALVLRSLSNYTDTSVQISDIYGESNIKINHAGSASYQFFPHIHEEAGLNLTQNTLKTQMEYNAKTCIDDANLHKEYCSLDTARDLQNEANNFENVTGEELGYSAQDRSLIDHLQSQDFSQMDNSDLQVFYEDLNTIK
jgi:hypothetical protein